MNALKFAPQFRGSPPRRGFTLVELLVTITILLIVVGMTIAAVNVTMNSDRVTSGARQIQGALEGARARAVSLGRPVGLRFLRDPAQNNTMNATVYVEIPVDYTEGTIQIASSDARTINTAASPQWDELVRRGMIVNGACIKLIDGTIKSVFAIFKDGANWKLTGDHWDDLGGATDTDIAYSIALAPAVMANQEPRPLPSGVVVDYNIGKQPSTWSPTSNTLDVMYGPDGRVYGPVGSDGLIHFVVVDVVDATRNRPLNALDREGDVKIVTLATSSGNVSVHSVDLTDVNPLDGFADDAVRFAELGEVTK